MTVRDHPFVETVLPAQARNTSGDTGLLTGYGAPTALRLALNVTAVSGTDPRLTPDLRIRWEITGTSPSFTFAVHLSGQ